MKHKIKNVCRDLAEHIGLKVKFVGYFNDEVQGKLLAREKCILINAHKPRVEHIYTLLHEIGHYLIHVNRLPRKYHPRIFDIRWKAEWLVDISSKVRRWYRFIFNKKSGKEWEADVWAMCALVYFAKQLGCWDVLFAFLNRHPEKFQIFLLVAAGIAYSDTKTRTKKAYQALRAPFSMI